MATKKVSASVVKHDKRFKSDAERREKPLQVVFNKAEFALLEDLTALIQRKGDQDFAEKPKGITFSSVIRELIRREAERNKDGITALKNAEAQLQAALEGV